MKQSNFKIQLLMNGQTYLSQKGRNAECIITTVVPEWRKAAWLSSGTFLETSFLLYQQLASLIRNKVE